jgi:hypothetical protein
MCGPSGQAGERVQIRARIPDGFGRVHHELRHHLLSRGCGRPPLSHPALAESGKPCGSVRRPAARCRLAGSLAGTPEHAPATSLPARQGRLNNRLQPCRVVYSVPSGRRYTLYLVGENGLYIDRSASHHSRRRPFRFAGRCVEGSPNTREEPDTRIRLVPTNSSTPGGCSGAEPLGAA